MERLTHERTNGIKTGYWSPNKKQELVDMLAAYENTRLTPEQIIEMDKMYTELAKEVMQLRKKDIDVPANDGWIPVEKELPEDNIEVLITYSDVDNENETWIDITTYGYATLGGNKLGYKEWRNPFLYFKGNYKVIAWQPLPEPYRPERSEGE